MSEQVTERLVHSNVYDPNGLTLFKAKANDRAQSQRVYCTAESCELLDAGCCTMSGAFGTKCPYGRKAVETGPTKRAKSCRKWCDDRRTGDVPCLKSPPVKMAFIGVYVYLPYAHMTMCEKVPFAAHSHFLLSGNCFLPREWWTVEVVETLIDFRPIAMMGGEIKQYQAEVIPKFVQHLRECDSAMFANLTERRPELNSEPNYVGRNALLSTLRHPIEWTTDKSYPVTWKWDGQFLTTDSQNAYHSTWGGLKARNVSVRCEPEPDATIVVQNNDWVAPATRFVD